MNTGDEFIRLYNELTAILQQKSAGERNSEYASLVREVANKDAVVRRRRAFLLAVGRLRNAIVHDRNYPPRVIADPREDIVDELRRTIDTISHPEKVIPRFQRDVRVFEPDDPLAECLEYMGKRDFSQVVVHTSGMYRLLSTEGIVAWLAKSRDVGLADIEAGTVSEALELEDGRSCRYISRREPVDVAMEVFQEALSKGIPRLLAILVTENGKETERPLGIVTPWDLLNEAANL